MAVVGGCRSGGGDGIRGAPCEDMGIWVWGGGWVDEVGVWVRERGGRGMQGETEKHSANRLGLLAWFRGHSGVKEQSAGKTTGPCVRLLSISSIAQVLHNNNTLNVQVQTGK